MLLALFLLKTEFANNRAISIIGFSLGTVITLECIKFLKEFYRLGYVKAGRIISDVYLWGGAAVLNPNGLYAEIL